MQLLFENELYECYEIGPKRNIYRSKKKKWKGLKSASELEHLPEVGIRVDAIRRSLKVGRNIFIPGDDVSRARDHVRELGDFEGEYSYSWGKSDGCSTKFYKSKEKQWDGWKTTIEIKEEREKKGFLPLTCNRIRDRMKDCQPIMSQTDTRSQLVSPDHYKNWMPRTTKKFKRLLTDWPVPSHRPKPTFGMDK